MPQAEVGATVLLVEDEPLTAMQMATSLRERGYGVDGPHADARSALMALEIATPQAALLDVSLGPAETSGAVADALAARGVPFAFLTGYGPETGPVVSAHPDRLVIPKPVDPETLNLVLGSLV